MSTRVYRSKAQFEQNLPTVLVAILAKQKAACLPLYLDCIDKLDYPKSKITLWVRENDSTDDTRAILEAWLDQHRHEYAKVHADFTPIDPTVSTMGVHEWTCERFRLLGRLRQESLDATLKLGCDSYFVADCDNFVRPHVLKRLVSLNRPLVAPMLRHVDYPANRYSNFFAAVDPNGYFAADSKYDDILSRSNHLLWNGGSFGVITVPLIHCTYLVRADAIPKLHYLEQFQRYEFVSFADSARKAKIKMAVDNYRDNGVIALDSEPADLRRQVDQARDIMRAENVCKNVGSNRHRRPPPSRKVRPPPTQAP